MSSDATAGPFELLLELDRRCREHAAPLPQPVLSQDHWHGILCQAGQLPLLVPLGEIREILDTPPLAAVPSAKPWVRGIANVRGLLLPVIDLAGYLGRPLIAIGPQSKILVLNHERLFAGLLVEAVQGLQHFALEETIEPFEAEDARLRAYARSAFPREADRVAVLSLRALAEDPEFLHLAA